MPSAPCETAIPWPALGGLRVHLALTELRLRAPLLVFAAAGSVCAWGWRPLPAALQPMPPPSLVQWAMPLMEACTPCGTMAASVSKVDSMSLLHSTTPCRCPPAHTPRVSARGATAPRGPRGSGDAGKARWDASASGVRAGGGLATAGAVPAEDAAAEESAVSGSKSHVWRRGADTATRKSDYRRRVFETRDASTTVREPNLGGVKEEGE